MSRNRNHRRANVSQIAGRPQDHKQSKNTVRRVNVRGIDIDIDPKVLDDWEFMESLYDLQADPKGNDSWLMGIQAHISHDDGSEGATVFGPRNYGPKTLKTGTLQCNIFVNTTGEVDKTFTPRLYKID